MAGKQVATNAARIKRSLTTDQKQEVSKLVQRQMARKVELKYFVYGAQPTVIAGTPVITSLCDIVAGDEDIDRNGDRINYTKLHLKYQIDANVAATLQQHYVRVIVFQWLPNTSLTSPTMTNLLTPDGFTTTITYQSAQGHDTRDMWRILYDTTHCLVGGGSIATSKSSVWYDGDINLGPAIKHLQFSGGSTNGTNKLFIGFLSSAATQQPTIYWNSKLNFRDP